MNTFLIKVINNIKINTKLIIAADGKNSAIKKIIGNKTYKKNYNENALVLSFFHEKNLNNTAYEIFYNSGPLAILPMKSKKYIIVSIIFLIWISFLSNPSLTSMTKSKNNIKKIDKEIEYYSKKITEDSTTSRKLKNDTSFIIKIAREKYLMKKNNEKIFFLKD